MKRVVVSMNCVPLDRSEDILVKNVACVLVPKCTLINHHWIGKSYQNTQVTK